MNLAKIFISCHLKLAKSTVLVSNDRERLRDFWKNTTVPQEITQPCIINWLCAIINIFYCEITLKTDRYAINKDH